MELADIVEAEACVARNEELVSDLGQPTLTWAARQHRATLHVLRGDAEAERAMAASKELAPDGLGEFLNGAQRWTLRLARSKRSIRTPLPTGQRRRYGSGIEQIWTCWRRSCSRSAGWGRRGLSMKRRTTPVPSRIRSVAAANAASMGNSDGR